MATDLVFHSRSDYWKPFLWTFSLLLSFSSISCNRPSLFWFHQKSIALIEIKTQAKFSEHSNYTNGRDKMIALLQSQLQKVQADSLVLTERIKRLNDENRLNGTLGLGSPDFLATNVSLDLNSYSLDSLRELKALVDRESEFFLLVFHLIIIQSIVEHLYRTSWSTYRLIKLIKFLLLVVDVVCSSSRSGCSSILTFYENRWSNECKCSIRTKKQRQIQEPTEPGHEHRCRLKQKAFSILVER